MYIAFKWLLGLTFIMWISMCCLDAYAKKHIVYSTEGIKSRALVLNMKNNTNTDSVRSKIILHAETFTHKVDKHYGMVYLHCFMFVAGALVVSVYNRMEEIIIIFIKVKRELVNIFSCDSAILLQEYSKVTAAAIYCYVIMLYKEMCVKLKHIVLTAKTAVSKKFYIKFFHKPRVNLLLLKKFKEMGEERNSLARLLIAALRENKNVRMQYQLENMAKKRLVRHIEKTEKIIKENRSRYVSFQQLYLVTHQENTFLKCRLKKLTSDKQEAEKDLMELLNEVFKSKNTELKTFCNRFIVRTKHSLLNSDAEAEIQTFLRKSRAPVASSSSLQLAERPDIEVCKANSWLKCSSCTHMAEYMTDNALFPLANEAPKLRGLPGEYVWTVKDKDGLIEKLYECNYYETDIDAGDTIRRIREYSVYHDKDCLLDLSNSTTLVTERDRRDWTTRPPCSPACDLVTTERFLTGSEAFKQFMQRNENVVSMSILPKPRLLSN